MMTEVEAIHQLAGEVYASDICCESATDPSQVQRVLEEIRDQEPVEVQELNLEPDVYNHDLLEWVSQSVYHVHYCDDILSEYGSGLNFFEVIQSAQVRQLEAIAYEVWEWLEERAEEIEDQPEDEDYVISPCGPLGSRHCVGVVGGHHLGEFVSYDNAITAIRLDMLKNNVHTGVWFVSDHGNAQQINIFE